MNKIVRKMATRIWICYGSIKFQAPNHKQYPNSNFKWPIPPRRDFRFGHLVIGDYLEFGIWILRFRCLFGSGYAELGKGG
jgi:hypothetical protein